MRAKLNRRRSNCVCVGLVVRETKFEPLFDQFFREMDMPAVSTMSQGMNVSVFKSTLDG